MTAFELPSDEAEGQSAWTIVGSRHDGIVRHLALLAQDVSAVKYGDKVPVYHMGPPLTSMEPDPVGNEDFSESIVEEAPGSVKRVAHVVARLDDLSDDERQGMRRWYRKTSASFTATMRPSQLRPRRGEEQRWANFFEQCHYIAHPPSKIEEDPVSNVEKHRWFSCVGFVTQCYEDTAVEQVLTDPDREDFPRVDKAAVERMFLLGTLQLTPEIAKAINLTGKGPWPIAMPGYVMRAFDRADEEIRATPYHPRTDDIEFLGS